MGVRGPIFEEPLRGKFAKVCTKRVRDGSISAASCAPVVVFLALLLILVFISTSQR